MTAKACLRPPLAHLPSDERALTPGAHLVRVPGNRVQR